MKIISLNIWAGIVFEPLMAFLKKQASDTDIFCFQELLFGTEEKIGSQGEYRNIFQVISSLLSEFTAYPMLAPEGSWFQGNELEPGLRVGQAIFIRKGIKILDSGEMHTYMPDSRFAKDLEVTITGNFNHVRLRNNNKDILIGNLHGVWQAEGKGDTEERLEQSRILRKFLDKMDCEQVVVGDFNMLPDIQSMAILERGMRNLIKEFGVASTRSNLYKKRIPFSDYALVSGVDLRYFQVADVVVSDHLPLILEIRET
ncbi:MAG: hypothetical protein A2946_01070 [Candidatus Liptonbacteria bacterium RIFCSPLOWO2_01_FULL_53_13]|uniref:Endonuclease/exonuclease/phosphatase domain-containing protein n=1 Tax=Candidatus Liptonbacteria bacterium RIFCSPLOWO2_01_FULL_53_13 TaxID=1798651 RepID=A0A1G2CJ65_9BACT|nr:MAG: hypothetical protein A2946_01070 [Candidatus Liptonbacteria bacterium RIFCSPLOWO2_01_FULL_53_13]